MSSTVSAVPKAGGGAGGGEDATGAKKGKGKLIIVAVLVLALVGGGAYFFVLKPKSASASTTKKADTPEKGDVVAVDPINMNLAGGHYLKLGFGMQLTKATKTPPDASEASDIAIEMFSGQDMDKLSDAAYRDKLKTKFTKAVVKAYEDKKGTVTVMDVYYTAFVMQ